LGKSGSEKSEPHLSERHIHMIRIRKFYKLVAQVYQNRVVRNKLAKLDDRMLQDIGIPRSEVDAVLKSDYRRTRHFDF
jgi:uncharacterized protein YjiS (DUF1127 family)